jgi:hypothetical protein
MLRRARGVGGGGGGWGGGGGGDLETEDGLKRSQGKFGAPTRPSNLTLVLKRVRQSRAFALPRLTGHSLHIEQL